MEAAFGRDVRRSTIVEQLASARDAAAGAALGGAKTQALGARLEEMLQVQYDDAMRAAANLRENDDPVALLPNYGRGRVSAVEASRALARTAEEFFAKLEQELSNLESEFEAADESVTGNLGRLKTALQVIATIDSRVEK
jgi:hypothetical protein